MLRRQVAHRDVHRHAVLLRHLRGPAGTRDSSRSARASPRPRPASSIRPAPPGRNPPDHPPEAAQVSQAPIGELNENRPGVASEMDVAVRAMQAGRIAPHRLARRPSRRLCLHPLARRMHRQAPMTALQRRLQRLGQANPRRSTRGSGPATTCSTSCPRHRPRRGVPGWV